MAVAALVVLAAFVAIAALVADLEVAFRGAVEFPGTPLLCALGMLVRSGGGGKFSTRFAVKSSSAGCSE